MDPVYSFLLFCQALGSLIGAATAVWAEFAYVRAVRDGHVTAAELKHLKIIWHGLYFGMTLVLLSMLGMVLSAYITAAQVQPGVTTNYWILAAFTLIILGISWGLAHKKISHPLGSALIFSAWWFLAYLTGGWLPSLTFGAAIAFYVVVATVHYMLLKHARLLTLRKA